MAECQRAARVQCIVTSPFRTHGSHPLCVVVVHGGPGADGDLGDMATRLALHHGVLEPMQTATTIDGQIDELKAVIESQAEPPVYLIGHSWGAWLAALLTARHPNLVGKLILVASGPFEAKYVAQLSAIRAERRAANADSDNFAPIMPHAREVEPLPHVPVPGLFEAIWPAANQLRASGELLETVATIGRAVVAIHGDYDPHPADGVREPLTRVLTDFRMILLERCGHSPWRERYAAESFYDVVERELTG
jgi:pimeloyl-ACP methyl ester carboxylesterase